MLLLIIPLSFPQASALEELGTGRVFRAIGGRAGASRRPASRQASDAVVHCLLPFRAIGGRAEASRRPASRQASDALVQHLLPFRAIGGRGRLGAL